MNKILIAATLAALVASPAFAKSANVHKRTMSQHHASQSYASYGYAGRGYAGNGWLQPSVRGAQARYLDVVPYPNDRFDAQTGYDYEQRP